MGGGEREENRGKGGSSAISRACSGSFETKNSRKIISIGDTDITQHDT